MKRFLVIFIVLVLASFSLSFAVPGIDVRVQSIGSGQGFVHSPVESGYLWITYYRSGGTRYVDKVYLTFSNDVNSSTEVYVILETTNGNRYVRSAVFSSISAGQVLAFDFSNESIRKNRLNASATRLVLRDGFNTYHSGSASLSIQKLGLGVPVSGRGCVLVNVTERSGEVLYNYSVMIRLRNRDIDWNVANESNVYVTTLSGEPLYFWIKKWDAGSNEAILWVKMPELPANATVTLCINYGLWPNSYSKYNSLKKTFLFVETFDSLNLSAWNAHGSPSASGNLTLNGGDWIWTNKSFGNHYAFYVSTYLGRDNGKKYKRTSRYKYSLGPFFIVSMDSGNLSGIGFGRRYRNTQKTKVSGKLVFPSNGDPQNGTWTNIRRSRRLRFEKEWFVFGTYYAGTFKIFRKDASGGWDDIQNGEWVRYFGFRNGYQQFASVSNLVGGGVFGLGQWCGGPSYYGWVIVRNYVQKEPTPDVVGEAYTLVFRP